MSLYEATNKDETMVVLLKVENGNGYIEEISIYVDAIGDWVVVPESFDKKITKMAEHLVADFMEDHLQHRD